MNDQNNQNQLVVRDSGPVAHLMDTARFNQLKLVAGVLANGSITPKHLRGNSPTETLANCIRVVNQAIRWELDPFAVADESYVIHGRLGFQGKLVAAVINTRADLVGGLAYEFTGSGDDRTVTVSGIRHDWEEPRSVDLSVRQAQTENEMWRRDPDQKLVYSGAIRWARRHCPEIVLGVLTDDDVDLIAESNGDAVALSDVVEQATDPARLASLEARFASQAAAVPAATALPAPQEPLTAPQEPPTAKTARKRRPRQRKAKVVEATATASENEPVGLTPFGQILQSHDETIDADYLEEALGIYQPLRSLEACRQQHDRRVEMILERDGEEWSDSRIAAHVQLEVALRDAAIQMIRGTRGDRSNS